MLILYTKKITDCKESVYNTTYPFSKPRHTKYGIEYRFGVITDMDEESKGMFTSIVLHI